MEKYLLFAGERHYSIGGMHDLIQQSDSIKEIWKTIHNLKDPSYEGSGWWHLYNTEAQRITDCSILQPYGSPYKNLSGYKDIIFYKLYDHKWIKVDFSKRKGEENAAYVDGIPYI